MIIPSSLLWVLLRTGLLWAFYLGEHHFLMPTWQLHTHVLILAFQVHCLPPPELSLCSGEHRWHGYGCFSSCWEASIKNFSQINFVLGQNETCNLYSSLSTPAGALGSSSPHMLLPCSSFASSHVCLRISYWCSFLSWQATESLGLDNSFTCVTAAVQIQQSLGTVHFHSPGYLSATSDSASLSASFFSAISCWISLPLSG